MTRGVSKKKSRELKEGGALLMEKRLIYIDNQ